MKIDLPKTYNPSEVEFRIYKLWEDSGFFTPKLDPKRKQPFTMVIPPPNITGELHMGHALNATIQDILARKKRMEGIPTLWLPGTDHAGIAAQNVVEKLLKKLGKTRFDLGREKFIERMWEWKKKYGGIILDQLKKLGCSCDWTRVRFTMDEDYSKAVLEAFITLFKKGYIYKGERVINWCPRCETSLSDLELEYKEEKSKLYYLKYPLKTSGSKKFISVATTRPETMLGDTAVAVNPKDRRYKNLVGKKCVVPLVNREIPIIYDDAVEREFGTGAVKVTPAHDPVDFEIGERHKLEKIVVIDQKGKINENGGVYKDLDRYKAREKIIADLKNLGLLEKEEDYSHSVARCYRCDTIIEPLLSLQWFCKMKELAKPAIEVVEKNKVEFFPEKWKKVYLSWMREIKDWCLSRQIWWGHQLPIYYCKECGNIVASVKNPIKCPKCRGKLEQDPDVLDTWFSSALWPFAVFGWPKKTKDLYYFYPTSILVTARDIIFLWVARMIMMGLEFQKEIPFRKVIVHATVLTKEGKRMSKSLGTGVDPLELVRKYGADATRFGLIWQTAKGQDVRFSEEQLEEAKHFANKLWNASRYIGGLFEFLKDHAKEKQSSLGEIDPAEEKALSLPDRWILSRVNRIIKEVTNAIEGFEFSEAVKILYRFVWNEFCDWYIEITKINPSILQKQILVYVLKRILKLVHPFMPFVSEELFQKLKPILPLEDDKELLLVSKWPEVDEKLISSKIENDFEKIKQVILAIRSVRSEYKISPKKKIKALVYIEKGKRKKDIYLKKLARLFEENKKLIEHLAGLKELLIQKEGERPDWVPIYTNKIDIYIPPSDLKEIDKEKEKIKKEIEVLEKVLFDLEKRINDKKFLDKAPKHVIEKEKKRYQEYKEKLQKLEKQLD